MASQLDAKDEEMQKQDDLLQKQSASWHPGNALSVLLRPEMATPQAAPLGNVIAFDKEGYSVEMERPPEDNPL